MKKTMMSIVVLCIAAMSAHTGNARALKVVATTSIVGDVATAIGGDAIELRVLIPRGADLHSFHPTPRDGAVIAQADVLFLNGLGLEEWLDPFIKSAGAEVERCEVSESIVPRTLHEHGHRHSGPCRHGDTDPHVWLDPNNVMVWSENIRDCLTRLDPANGELYSARAAAYEAQLKELDEWIRQQVERVPQRNRRLVSEHDYLGYFAERYGFEVVGSVLPGFSTASEPSAREMAALQDRMNELNVPAVFVGSGAIPKMMEQLAKDTRTKIVRLHVAWLGPEDGSAGTYVDAMRCNTTRIVEALSGDQETP